MSTELNAKMPEKATPATITMRLDAYRHWLSEVKGLADPNVEGVDPDLFIGELNDPNNRYFLVEAYLNTAEGTVIARHLIDCNSVDVTMRETKPGPQLMRTVRWMLGEEGEAA